ncbi:MAG: polysaccharide deacetylase family protein, partial [Leptolyngbyaceae cyanobacterium SL_7_1]|nr:polysaccharide deacetylase family protein [Leptolyngbyaceae cyanobacterium SL_7_1]
MVLSSRACVLNLPNADYRQGIRLIAAICVSLGSASSSIATPLTSLISSDPALVPNAAIDPNFTAQCQTNPVAVVPVTTAATGSGRLKQTLVAALAPTLSQWMAQHEPTLVAQLSTRPYPEIHDRARAAKVPILMYHDILAEKQVFFDVTPEEFEAHLQLLQSSGITPISADQLTQHLASGTPLPEKPVLLTFDDGYAGHYQYVYPLLRQYGYPAVFSIYTSKVGTTYGRSSLTWEQIKQMAADPLVTIAAHSVTHPDDLREMSVEEMRYEIAESKRILEAQLGLPIKYFTYPAGHYDEQVAAIVQEVGYAAAFTMDNYEDRFAGESETLLAVDRIGQSAIDSVIEEAWGGLPLPSLRKTFDFTKPVEQVEVTIDDVPLILISGGKPSTIHADSRYQVPEIIAGTEAIAAVDGGFFSLKYLDSNVMVGPVLDQHKREFVPGNPGEIPLIAGRPMVLISPDRVDFVPFDPTQHNTLEGVQAVQPAVTDAFVAAAWLVKDSAPQPAESFGTLFDFDANRHRAFWGNQLGGATRDWGCTDRVDSISLGEA